MKPFVSNDRKKASARLRLAVGRKIPGLYSSLREMVRKADHIDLGNT